MMMSTCVTGSCHNKYEKCECDGLMLVLVRREVPCQVDTVNGNLLLQPVTQGHSADPVTPPSYSTISNIWEYLCQPVTADDGKQCH